MRGREVDYEASMRRTLKTSRSIRVQKKTSEKKVQAGWRKVSGVPKMLAAKVNEHVYRRETRRLKNRKC